MWRLVVAVLVSGTSELAGYDTKANNLMPQPELPEPLNVLYRIKRGLTGYVSYLAACQMNTAMSEYTLYEPVLRILTARGFDAACEVVAPGFASTGSGDKKRIDFEASNAVARFALEVKWAKQWNVDVRGDIAKLVAYRAAANGRRAFLCIFGTLSVIDRVRPSGCAEVGRKVIADLGRTRYACRIFEPSRNKALESTKRRRQTGQSRAGKPAARGRAAIP